MKTYNLPSNHNLFLDSSVDELLVMFWEDVFDKKPLEAYRTKDGHIQFTDTGDELIDKWEAELAEGKMPDYMEGFSSEAMERLEHLRTKGTDKFGHRRSIADTVEDVARRTGGTVLPTGHVALPNKRFKDVDD